VPVRKRAYDNSSRLAAAEQTRERILDAFYELLIAEHYDLITIAKIAQRAGVSPQTIVLHFKTKDGLFEALLHHHRPREEAAREVTDGDPREAAEKICARYEENGAAVLRMLALEGRLPAADKLVTMGRASHHAWVEHTFTGLGSGAVKARRFAQLVAVYDIYTWHLLRRVLSAEETVTAMAEMARGVLEQGKGRR